MKFSSNETLNFFWRKFWTSYILNLVKTVWALQPMKFMIFHVGNEIHDFNCQRESVYLVVTSAMSNITLANIFLSQIEFIKVLTGDVVLVSMLVKAKHKVNLTSHFLWAVSKYQCSMKIYHACLFFFTFGCKYSNWHQWIINVKFKFH